MAEAEMNVTIDFEAAQQLKTQGNTEYSKKQYQTALDLYSQSLQCIAINTDTPAPPSLINGTDTEFYRDMLGRIELNLQIKDLRPAISKIFSNRAACHLNLKQYLECIHNSNLALLYDATNENALYRRGLSYERLKQYAHALQSYRKLLQINEHNSKALDGCNRCKAIMSKKTQRTVMYTEAIEALQKSLEADEHSDAEIISHIGIVVNQVFHSEEYHNEIIVELRFTHILFGMLLFAQTPLSWNVRIECVRALNAVIGRVTLNDCFSKDNEMMIAAAFGGDKYTTALLAQSTDFLSRLVHSLDSEDDKQAAPGIEPKEATLMQQVMEFLVSLASHKYLFDKRSDGIFAHLSCYFKQLKYRHIEQRSRRRLASLLAAVPKGKQPDEAKDNHDAHDDDDATQKAVCDVLVSLMKRLSDAALRNNQGNYQLIEKIRTRFFRQLLLTDLSLDLVLRSEIQRFFVCASGLKSVMDQLNDAKLSALKSKFEAQISTALSTPLVAALKSKSLGSSNPRLVAALRGLSVILQSNHKLGTAIAGKEDVLNCIVEVATCNEPTANADAQVTRPTQLDAISSLGIEVLSLSCSAAAVRDALIASHNQHIFAWNMEAGDLMVRAHAANALAKLAAIDEDSRELALGGPDRCLRACAATMASLLRDEELHGHDAHSDKDELFRSYKMPLMNLSIETLSYLSLHIETKRGLVADEHAVLKQLVAVSRTRFFSENRSLRHGLLTIVLNCSLSKEDVDRFLTEKEQQIAKLRKVVAQGLPKDPGKQDEAIQMRAGSKADIEQVQRALIAENCVFLVFNIVRCSAREQERMDGFVDEQIGLTDAHKVKMRVAEAQRRKERYSFDPDKYKKESAAAKLERKKLAALSAQKSKYAAFELSEALQLKICRVVMMMAAQPEVRGQLVQQKAVRLCMDLFFEHKHKEQKNNAQIREMASVAIARMCISVNPVLLNSDDVNPISECLLRLVSEANHELYIYEALLALCNLLALPGEQGEALKVAVSLHKKGWSTLRGAFEEDQHLINAALLECWCNLCTSPRAGVEQLHRNRVCDAQIVTLFIQHDHRRVQRAAVSILAMATDECYDEDGVATDIAREVARNGGVVMLQCLLNIRQKSLTETRFGAAKPEEVAMDKVIVERIRIAMANLERCGFSMHNLAQHEMKADVKKEFESYLK